MSKVVSEESVFDTDIKLILHSQKNFMSIKLSNSMKIWTALYLTRGAARPLGTLGQQGPLKWPLTFSSISINLENKFPSNFQTLQKNVCVISQTNLSG